MPIIKAIIIAISEVAWNGKSMINMPFGERINYINLEILKDLSYVDLAQYVKGQELWDLYGNVIAAGGEGIVITREDCQYLCGKRTAWMTLKMKKELEDSHLIEDETRLENLMEFKSITASYEERTLEETVKAALTQIEENNYDEKLLTLGVKKERILHYGFAFDGKEVLIG